MLKSFCINFCIDLYKLIQFHHNLRTGNVSGYVEK